jgi:hypothetical protein
MFVPLIRMNCIETVLCSLKIHKSIVRCNPERYDPENASLRTSILGLACHTDAVWTIILGYPISVPVGRVSRTSQYNSIFSPDSSGPNRLGIEFVQRFDNAGCAVLENQKGVSSG